MVRHPLSVKYGYAIAFWLLLSQLKSSGKVFLAHLVGRLVEEGREAVITKGV
jgi:hypothetical protein